MHLCLLKLKYIKPWQASKLVNERPREWNLKYSVLHDRCSPPSLPLSLPSLSPFLPLSCLPSFPLSLPLSCLPSLPLSCLPSLPPSLLPSLSPPSSFRPSLPPSLSPAFPLSLPLSFLPPLPPSLLPSLSPFLFPSFPLSLPLSCLPPLSSPPFFSPFFLTSLLAERHAQVPCVTVSVDTITFHSSVR